MKYAVSYDDEQSVFLLHVDHQPAVPFENHFAIFKYLDEKGLSEPDGDYIYDPVQKRFLFSSQYALDGPYFS